MRPLVFRSGVATNMENKISQRKIDELKLCGHVCTDDPAVSFLSFVTFADVKSRRVRKHFRGLSDAALLRLSRAPETDCPARRRPLKKSSGTHLWRMSNPQPRASPVLDRTAHLQKSLSAQDLATDRTSPHHFIRLFLK